jgi:hypothetical protein
VLSAGTTAPLSMQLAVHAQETCSSYTHGMLTVTTVSTLLGVCCKRAAGSPVSWLDLGCFHAALMGTACPA